MRTAPHFYSIRFVAGMLDETALRRMLGEQFDIPCCSIERAPWPAVETTHKAKTVQPEREKAGTRRPGRPRGSKLVLDLAVRAADFPPLRGIVLNELARVGNASTNEIRRVLETRKVRRADLTRVEIDRLRQEGFLRTEPGAPDDRHHLTERGQRLAEELHRLHGEAR
ncbi:hypothetical protein [Rubellimicrobium arenae]|uniref:hypothetical protein n=1 Tax=Rubellimicrobium arenae TaxID=2817372 RepID=UPI001B309110|nr:hypothetical protein [Rubellimicrobium arenae]